MRRFGLAVAFAAVVAVASVAAIPSSAPHPPRCSWATGVGDFCLQYVPALGRYELPPPGIPADMTLVDPADSRTSDARPLMALSIFVGLLGLMWASLTLASRLKSDA